MLQFGTKAVLCVGHKHRGTWPVSLYEHQEMDFTLSTKIRIVTLPVKSLLEYSTGQDTWTLDITLGYMQLPSGDYINQVPALKNIFSFSVLIICFPALSLR